VHFPTCPVHLAHPGTWKTGGGRSSNALTSAATDTPAGTNVVRADFSPAWRKSEHREANPLTTNVSAAGTLSRPAGSYAARRVY
jgi:hypothetical protein